MDQQVTAGVRDSIFRQIARVARADAAKAGRGQDLERQAWLLHVAGSWDARALAVEKEKIGDRLPRGWGYLKKD